MAPIGAIIFAEHYLFKRMGITRYWRIGRGDKLNIPAAITWAISALFAYILGSVFGIHIFFLFIPTWIVALILYPLLSSFMGAKSASSDLLAQMESTEMDRKKAEATAIQSFTSVAKTKRPPMEMVLLLIATFALLVCFYLGFKAAGSGNALQFKTAVIWPTVVYFIAAIILVFIHKDKTDSAN